MLYLDTSALLKLYILERHSDLVQAWVFSQSEPLPVWEIQEMELTNALRLKVFWNEIESGQAEEQLRHFESRMRRGQYYAPELDRRRLADTFRSLSEETPKTGCRTMDILHVACAVVLGASVFGSFDLRQNQLAEIAGLALPFPPPG